MAGERNDHGATVRVTPPCEEGHPDPGSARARVRSLDFRHAGGVPERSALAEFLQARRAAVQPADVGLPSSGRRRTPGLRREEVATLAGVSVDYLVRLEQGRDTNPSPAIVTALAAALRLDEEERVHLLKLAAKSGNEELCPSASATRTVAPSVRLLLDRLDPTPSFLVAVNRDVLAWNRAYERVAAPLGMLDGDRPNLAAFVFRHPRARTVLGDWAGAADDQVSALRAAAAFCRDDEWFGELVDDLTGEPEFARRWARHQVAVKRRDIKHIVHPDVGDLRLVVEVLHVADESDQSLISWLAADEATEAALDTIVTGGRRPNLRVVGDR